MTRRYRGPTVLFNLPCVTGLETAWTAWTAWTVNWTVDLLVFFRLMAKDIIELSGLDRVDREFIDIYIEIVREVLSSSYLDISLNVYINKYLGPCIYIYR